MSITISASTASAAVAKVGVPGQGKGQDSSGNEATLFAELVDSRLTQLQGGSREEKSPSVAEGKPDDEPRNEAAADQATLNADALATLLNQTVAPVVAGTAALTGLAQAAGHDATNKDGGEQQTVVAAEKGDVESGLASLIGTAADKDGQFGSSSTPTVGSQASSASKQTPAMSRDDSAVLENADDRRPAVGSASIAQMAPVASKSLEEKQVPAFGEKLVVPVPAPLTAAAAPLAAMAAHNTVMNPSGATTAAAVNLPVSTPVTHADWSKEVGRNVLLMANHKLDSAQMQLNPANLGPIEVTLKLEGDKIANVSFVAAAQPTRDALEQGMHKLANMLSQSGLQLNDANVFSGEQQQREAERQAQLAGQQRDSSDKGQRFSLDMADGRAEPVSVSDVTSRAVAAGDGSVSIYA